MSKNEMSIGEAIKVVLKEGGLQEGFDRATIISLWKSIVGEDIDKHTKSLRMERSVLYVEIDNACLKHELNFAREKLCSALNTAANKEGMVTKIVFM